MGDMLAEAFPIVNPGGILRVMLPFDDPSTSPGILLSYVEKTLHIGPWMVGLLFALLIVFWAVYTWIIFYHWGRFGTAQLEVLKMRVIYLTGSGILLTLMAITLIAYIVIT